MLHVSCCMFVHLLENEPLNIKSFGGTPPLWAPYLDCNHRLDMSHLLCHVCPADILSKQRGFKH